MHPNVKYFFIQFAKEKAVSKFVCLKLHVKINIAFNCLGVVPRPPAVCLLHPSVIIVPTLLQMRERKYWTSLGIRLCFVERFRCMHITSQNCHLSASSAYWINSTVCMIVGAHVSCWLDISEVKSWQEKAGCLMFIIRQGMCVLRKARCFWKVLDKCGNKVLALSRTANSNS